MSGPIVRKYGFPNFDEIFGKRDLEHGVDGKEPVDPLHLSDQSKVEDGLKSGSGEGSSESKPDDKK
ncbi:MAG: hypothetical protein WCJ40_03605 [Planctomycetota bacterium]